MYSLCCLLLTSPLAGCGDDPAVDGGVVTDGSVDSGSDVMPSEDAGADGGQTDGGTLDASVTDGGADAGATDAGPSSCVRGTPLPAQCTGASPSEMVLCFENASGCPGETIDVDIVIRAPAGCDRITQAGGGFDLGGLVLTNAVGHGMPSSGRCIRREACDICSPPSLDWGIFPRDAVGVPACPNEYPVSSTMPIDTLRFTIPPTLAPGDYTLPLSSSVNISSRVASCGAPPGGSVETRSGVAPTIRVY